MVRPLQCGPSQHHFRPRPDIINNNNINAANMKVSKKKKTSRINQKQSRIQQKQQKQQQPKLQKQQQHQKDRYVGGSVVSGDGDGMLTPNSNVQPKLQFGHVRHHHRGPSSGSVGGGYVTNNTTDTNTNKVWSSSLPVLHLNPWKDGIHTTMKILDIERSIMNSKRKIDTVHITFNEDCIEHDIHDHELIDLFESIGSDLPELEHLTIQYIDDGSGGSNNENNSNNDKKRNPLSRKAALANNEGGGKGMIIGGNNTVGVPPIQALTNILVESHNLRSITLLGLNFNAVDDYDMNGFVEALRIHPKLENFQMHSCVFGVRDHLESIKLVLSQKPKPGSSSSSTTKTVSLLNTMNIHNNMFAEMPNSPLSMSSDGNNTLTVGNEHWSGAMISPYDQRPNINDKPPARLATSATCGAVGAVDNCGQQQENQDQAQQQKTSLTDEYIMQIRTPPEKTDKNSFFSVDDEDELLTADSQTYLSWCQKWMCCQ